MGYSTATNAATSDADMPFPDLHTATLEAGRNRAANK
jgi:hypothetical protein